MNRVEGEPVGSLADKLRPLLRYEDEWLRPWMTRWRDPARARVFIVGHNQATTFTTEDVGDAEKYLSALFDPSELQVIYERARERTSKTSTGARKFDPGRVVGMSGVAGSREGWPGQSLPPCA